MRDRTILTIGGSSGGLHAVQKLVAVFPPQQSTAIFLVLHAAPDSPGLVADLVQSVSALPVSYAKHCEAFEPAGSMSRLWTVICC